MKHLIISGDLDDNSISSICRRISSNKNLNILGFDANKMTNEGLFELINAIDNFQISKFYLVGGFDDNSINYICKWLKKNPFLIYIYLEGLYTKEGRAYINTCLNQMKNLIKIQISTHYSETYRMNGRDNFN